MRPLILLSNDDGVHAPGLIALAEALEPLGDVTVVAPERERSAASHAITLHKPLRARAMGPGRYSLSGTPVDCIYVGVHKLCPRPPAMVVSGINNGPNLGSDVFYSGTFAAAAEGALRGIPSIAVSQSPGGDIGVAGRVAAELARAVLADGLPPRTVLNVNVPGGAPTQYRWTRLGARSYRDRVDEREDLRGRTYFWLGGSAVVEPDHEQTDGETVRRGNISITPVRLELTATDLVSTPPQWPLDGFTRIS